MRRCLLLLTGLLLLVACARGGETATPVAQPTATPLPTATPAPAKGAVHRCSGCGQWFPAEADKLAETIDLFLDDVPPPTGKGEPLVLIVPHAGYVYSGAVAAHAFRQVQGRHYDIVVIIGDTHSGAGSGPVHVYPDGSWETPLGTVAVDAAVGETLVQADERISFDEKAFAREHPIENQLPFLQRVLSGDFTIVPVVFREPSLENAQTVAEALVQALSDRQALVVCSTDLSHYPSYDDAREVDEKTLAAIVTGDPQAFLRATEEGMRQKVPNLVTCACSEGAVLTGMLVARAWNAQDIQVLKYANSGDTIFGERDKVVGYGAVVFRRNSAGMSGGNPGFHLPSLPVPSPTDTPLNEEEQAALLHLARKTLEWFLNAWVAPVVTPELPGLWREQGAFVTLEKEGELRGCIGNLQAQGPLYLTVQRMAVSAAVNDPRFSPVTADELDELTIEVSVLSPLQEVGSPEDIVVGKHGVVLVKDGHQAVFLPQVAPEQGWDRDEMLNHLARKAGLPEDAWRSGAHFFVFTAQVFAEE